MCRVVSRVDDGIYRIRSRGGMVVSYRDLIGHVLEDDRGMCWGFPQQRLAVATVVSLGVGRLSLWLLICCLWQWIRGR